MKINTPDRYDIEARYVPALVCTIPFLFLGFYYLNGLDSAFWRSTFAVNVGSISFSSAIFFMLVHFCRAIGKAIEEKIYRDGLSFPTTEFLLDNNTSLSKERKSEIIKKVNDKFGVDITNRTGNTDTNRLLIHECVSQIRSVLRKNNPMILQRNIQFGFAKNLLGGSVLAFFTSTFGLAASVAASNNQATRVSFVLICCYSVLVLASFLLMRLAAKHYAHTLYEEFLG